MAQGAPDRKEQESIEDLTYQVRSWRIERAGQVLMGLFILAALLGLLGGGPLSRASATGQLQPFRPPV